LNRVVGHCRTMNAVERIKVLYLMLLPSRVAKPGKVVKWQMLWGCFGWEGKVGGREKEREIVKFRQFSAVAFMLDSVRVELEGFTSRKSLEADFPRDCS
jgi:hypothetical protein